MNIAKKKVESEIFTGSMADISFLLIIFFMITSAFSATRGLDFALPEDTTTPPEIKQEDSVDVMVRPGPIDGSWSTSPTRISRERCGTALSRW